MSRLWSAIGFTVCVLAAFAIIGINSSTITNRIVNGKLVNIEDYPYQVSVRMFWRQRCGGSIVSENWVLTAAHCVRWPAILYSIRWDSSFKSKGGHIVRISEKIVHKKYKWLKRDYDIALLRTSTPLRNGDVVAKPIPLPHQDQVFPIGAVANVSGWGDCKCAEGVEQLRAVEVPIYDHSRCRELYKQIGPVTERMICAGYDQGGKDSCQGDSGGPLVLGGVLVGIVSWGYGCALPNYPGVYTNVANFRLWIADNAEI